MFTGKGRQVDFKRVANKTEYEVPPRSGKAINRTLPHGAEISAKGLVLPDDLNFDEWKAIGLKLFTIDKAVQWAIGDWWAYGHHLYGDRKAFAAAKELPYHFGSLMNLGSVARSVQPSFRNEALSFTHHVAVASLDPPDQKKWLTRAENLKWSVSKLRGAIHEGHERQLMDCPGFAPLSEPKKWLHGFLRRADWAERACTWPHALDFEALDLLQDPFVEQLIEAATVAANAWNDVPKKLREYLQQRQGTTIQSLPEDREPK